MKYRTATYINRHFTRFVVRGLAFYFLYLLGVVPVNAQQQDPEGFIKHKYGINKRALKLLGSWAIINASYSGARAFNARGIDKHFHIMNATWGGINLLIAGIGLVNANKRNHDTDLYQISKEQMATEQFLLFNAGIDLAYIAGGFYLWERANHFQLSDLNKYQKFKGYGRSFILQGGFLLTFDLALFFIHKSHARKQMPGLLKNLYLGNRGVGILLNL